MLLSHYPTQWIIILHAYRLLFFFEIIIFDSFCFLPNYIPQFVTAFYPKHTKDTEYYSAK